MIPVLARPHTIDARGFSATSHVQALIDGHTSHALSLNDICDALSVHASEFMRVRGATPPARNTISNANRTRDPAIRPMSSWKMPHTTTPYAPTCSAPASCAPRCGSRPTSANCWPAMGQHG
jgi:hypothetical protein